jgi:hypothetical protein
MSTRRTTALIAATFCASSALTPAAATVIKAGTNFATNNCRCAQAYGAVAGGEDGGFHIGWQGTFQADKNAVVGRSFDRHATPLTEPELVDLEIPFTGEAEIDLAADLASGGYVATWSSGRYGSNRRDIFFRRLGSDGAPLGPPVAVTADDPAAPTRDAAPVVAVGPDGSLAVAWMSATLPGGVAPPGVVSVLLRRFDAGGDPLGDPVTLNRGPASMQRPEVCVDPVNGVAAVAWTSVAEVLPFQKTPSGVSVRRVSAEGELLGGEIVVAPPTLENGNVALSCSPNGGFVVAWDDQKFPGWLGNPLPGDVTAARYGRSGKLLGEPFAVPAKRGGNETRPRVSHDPDGNFVLVWQDANARSYTIEGRRFFADGTPDGGDFEVIARPIDGAQIIRPDVAHRGQDGDFVVVFEKTGVINGQRFKVE